MSYVDNSEMDALLSRVREDKADPSGKNRNVVAYDCWRMFEDLATRYKEECAMRSRDKRQSRAWMDKALSLAQEARCPVCVNGQTLAGETCQECHGKDSASVAYDTLRTHYKRMAEACKLAFKLPRPWMDGETTYEEWDAVFTAIEEALAWKIPDKHVPPDVAPYDWQGQSEL